MCFPIAILFFTGIGILELKFPNALSLNTFHDNYTGRGWAGLIVLIFELIVAAAWGKTSGTILIYASILLVSVGVINYVKGKSRMPAEEAEASKEATAPVITSLAAKSAIWGYRRYKNRRKSNSN